MFSAMQHLNLVIYTSSNFALLKITENPKKHEFIWVILKIFIILEIKNEKF